MSESEFEAELRALKPAPPSPALELSVARELEGLRTLAVRPAAGVILREPQRNRFSFLRNLGWAFGGAAFAGLCAILLFPPTVGTRVHPHAAAPAPETFFEPLESARQLLSSETSEVFYDGTEGPAQVVRYSSVERHRWSNPETGALVEVEVPREDLFLIPVSYQ